MSELASTFGVHPVQITQRKKQAPAELPEVFGRRRDREVEDHEALKAAFVERLWRTVKCEEVYLKDYGSVLDARAQLGRYFHFCNHDRPHHRLAYQTPAAVYADAQVA